MPVDYSDYRRELLHAVEVKAACGAIHLHTQPVRLIMDGSTKWNGKVEVYQLKGHPQARLAFGWGYMSKGKVTYVTVMGVPPLETPLAAVKAFVASNSL